MGKYQSNSYRNWSSRGQERENEQKIYMEKLRAKNSTNSVKDINLQVQEA